MNRTVADPAEADRTLVLTRVIPAPPEAVWRAWTDPARLPGWWGPRGYSCRTHEIEIAEGGVWRFDMTGPDGTVYPNRHRFTRIVPGAAIDYHLDDDGRGEIAADVFVTFEEVAEGTRLTLRMVLPGPEARHGAERAGAVAHGYTTLDCLAEAAMGEGTLSITRILAAPPARVWDCWTDPALLAEWFVPDAMRVAETDFAPAPGRTWRTILEARDGTRHIASGRFEALEPPGRLCFSHGWEDETGTVRNPTRVTVTFEAEGGGTRMVFLQEGLPDAGSREGHRGGWEQTFTRLARAVPLRGAG